MGFGTTGVAFATAPAIIRAFFSHLRHHRSLRNSDSPESEVSYAEGIAIIRSFLEFASKHTVEEIQSFTKAKVPVPSWVIHEHVVLDEKHTTRAAEVLREEFDDLQSTEALGGSQWWTFRSEGLLVEWIEMRKTKMERELQEQRDKAAGKTPEPLRVLLYIHGGAHHFSSIETHRYQIQRHARKFGAKALAPSYRLAPQFPFPCQLHDALSAYLYLIDECGISPAQIIVSGDSAGGGTALSLLCVLRDRSLPMPAGGCLISPWLDLTHSFPSIWAEDTGKHDYIPAHGFHYKPSLSWPPPPCDKLSIPVSTGEPDLVLDQQMQMQASNALLDHPLVTLVNQGSLGGLPPLCFVHGNGELLRDEQIYAAHKAANPERYPPSEALLKKYPVQRKKLTQYPPTKVHLITFDGACHVLPTLAYATPSKFMYRAAASFNLWAVKLGAKMVEARSKLKKMPSNTSLSQVRHRLENDMLLQVEANDHVPEDVSLDSEASSISDLEDEGTETIDNMIIVTGAPPPFRSSIVRERVSMRGRRRPMEPEEEMDCLELDPNTIGILKDGPPIRKWLARDKECDSKFGKLRQQMRDTKEEQYRRAQGTGFLTKNLQGERPPVSSVVGWADPNLAMKCVNPQSSFGRKEQVGNMVWAKLSAAPDEAEAGVKEVEKVSKKLAECKTPGAEKVSEKLTGGTHKVVEATGKDHRRPNAMLEKQSSEEDASAKADV